MEPEIVKIQTQRDPRGSLSVLDSDIDVKFDIARAYWIYNVPSDAERDGHAFLSQSEIIIAMSGSFDVITETAAGIRKFHLDRPYFGLYIPPLTWRSIENFSTLSTALVVSSTLFSEDDYVRDINAFREIIKSDI